jgi:hypothetical protein
LTKKDRQLLKHMEADRHVHETLCLAAGLQRPLL